MRLSGRITGILGINLLIFALYIVFSHYLILSHTNQFMKMEIAKQNQSIDNSLSVQYVSIEAPLHNEACRNELSRYVRERDPSWAKGNIDTLLPNFRYAAVWVFTSDGHLIHGVSDPESPELGSMPPISPKVLETTRTNRQILFFHKQGGVLYMVGGSTIHPSSDIERKGPPLGYLFFARAVDRDFLSMLERLTLSHIRVRDGIRKFQAGSTATSVLYRPLPGDGAVPAAYLEFTYEYPFRNTLDRDFLLSLCLCILIAVLIFIVGYFFNRRWIRKPVDDIIRFLQTERAEALPETRKRMPEEFSLIVDALEDYQRKKKVLIENESVFREMFDQHHAVMMMIDSQNGAIVNANQAASRFYGYTLEEFLRMDIHRIEVLLPKKILNQIEHISRLETSYFEARHRLKSGEIRDVAVHASPVRQGEKTIHFSIVQDITEKKRMEIALRNSEQRWLFALNGSEQGVWDWNIPEGDVLFSPQWKSIMEWDSEAPLASISEWEKRIHPEDKAQNRREMIDCLAGRTEIYYSEFRVITRSLDAKWVLARGKVVSRDQEGKPVRFIGTLSDISPRKHMEEELRFTLEKWESANAELTRINSDLTNVIEDKIRVIREKDQLLGIQSRQAAMGEMLGNIAHQWKQPLSAFSILFQNLEYLPDDDVQRKEKLARIETRGRDLVSQMSQTIDDFRNFFKPDREKSVFPVSRPIHIATEIVEGSFKSSGIRLDLEIARDPALTGYPNEYGQIVLNLLNNARDILLERKIETPRVTVLSVVQEGNSEVSVTDNGGGISEEVIEKIGTLYFTTKANGTGIGLHMCRTILENHFHGRLEIDNIGEGACFRVVVPLIQPEDATAGSEI